MRLRPYGERAVLCDVAEPAGVPGMRAAAAELDGVAEVVAGARTLLVVVRPGADLDSVRSLLLELTPTQTPPAPGGALVLDVRYDGPDLDEVAGLSGLTRDEVVDLHERGRYTVRFCGFAPGFAYLDGLAQRLHVARRDDPRTSIPAGSVAIAGEFSGVYPRSSPGGWRVLGRTAARLWDVDRDPPALLTPGTRVRFRRA